MLWGSYGYQGNLCPTRDRQKTDWDGQWQHWGTQMGNGLRLFCVTRKHSLGFDHTNTLTQKGKPFGMEASLHWRTPKSRPIESTRSIFIFEGHSWFPHQSILALNQTNSIIPETRTSVTWGVGSVDRQAEDLLHILGKSIQACLQTKNSRRVGETRYLSKGQR